MHSLLPQVHLALNCLVHGPFRELQSTGRHPNSLAFANFASAILRDAQMVAIHEPGDMPVRDVIGDANQRPSYGTALVAFLWEHATFAKP